MWFKPVYILILLTTIVIDYSAALMIERTREHPRKRKGWLVASIVSTLVVLFIFKYQGLFHETHIILPIGLSFHTFQSLSYVIEVYRGNQKPEKHFGIYSLYVMFYPQLVTGPIERPQNLLRQLHEVKTLNYNNIANGLRLILFGLFLKMVVADNLGVLVDKVYDAPQLYSRGAILLSMLFYSFQIYGDFFGYSSIALGCALSMGFTLTDNFRVPYLAGSVREFWRRWHISLSSWFRDYLYIPLGGNRVGVPRWMLNTLIVFTVCGLWHGANWTFMLWGAAYGILLIVERALRTIHLGDGWRKVLRLAGVPTTFAIVTLLWSLFRAPSLNSLHHLYAALLAGNGKECLVLPPAVWVALGLFVAADIIMRQSRFDRWCGNLPAFLRWVIYGVMIFSIIVFSSVEQYPFIYFQF